MLDQAHLDRLIADHERWFEDRRTGARLELRGVSLRGLTIAGRRLNDAIFEDVDLSGADARTTKLWRAELRHVRLAQADLSGAELSDAQISDSDASGAQLVGARLDGVQARRCNFSNARLHRAVLVKAGCEQTHFDGADLTDAHCRRADFFHCSFVAATLRRVDFEYAMLSDADLRRADISEAYFLDTRLSAIKTYGVQGRPAVVANCDAEAIDASPAGDGTEPRDWHALLQQWGIVDPLSVAAVAVTRATLPAARSPQPFDIGFRVTLNRRIAVDFIPDIARDDGAWWSELPDNIEHVTTALAARRLGALLAAYVVTPNAARAGQHDLFVDGAPSTRLQPGAFVTRFFYVAPDDFARYTQELQALADAGDDGSIRPLHALRDRAFVRLLQERVLASDLLAPEDRAALSL